MHTNPHSVQAISRRLETVGQGHLLRFYDQLGEDARRALLQQIAEIDLERVPKLIEEYVFARPVFELPAEIQPAPYYPRDPKSGSRSWDEQAFRTVGERMLREGRVAAFVVAGGQGSRLGYEGPKGCYVAGALSRKPLFAFFADALLGARERYGVDVPWYIMTSPLNHAQTTQFFEAHNYFGLSREHVMFFPQGVMPSLDIKSGKILLASKDSLATNPDGHGGSLKALHTSGALADMRRRGIEIISYFQVDNPIVNPVDPVFIGLHAAAPDSSSQMSSKMVEKTDAGEKVGLFCTAGAGVRKGRVEVIEYSDMPRELTESRDASSGNLRFNAGSIAVHMLGLSFVERLNTDDSFSLPFHRAEKKVACVDPVSGEAIVPTTNNAVKLERFVFDALPLCEKSIVYQTDRIEEFAPIKNADDVGGSGTLISDSPGACTLIQTLRAARWLEACGVAVPMRPATEGERALKLPELAYGAGKHQMPDCTIELSPRTATNAGELREAVDQRKLKAIERGSRVMM